MVATPANMGEALWIGDAPGKNHFNVGIGQGTSGGQNHDDFPQSQIEDGYSDTDKFFLSTDRLAATFRINAGAGRTSANTAHPRSELRELQTNGTSLAAWDGRTGVHYMKGRSRVIDVTSNRPWVCFFQIHDSSSDLVRIQTEGDVGTSSNLSIVARRTPPGASEIRTVLRTGYNLNTWIAWEIRIDAGRLRVILDGVTALDVTGMGTTGCYFKCGDYLQDNVEKGATATDWSAVEMEAGSLQVWHTGYPAPTVPIFTGPDGGGITDSTPPTIPDDLSGFRGNNSATLNWEASTDNVGVTGYKVYRSAGGGGGTVGKPDDGPIDSASSLTKIAVSRFIPTVTGTITAAHARAWLSATGSSGTRVVVYTDDGALPGALLLRSDETTITATTEGVADYTVSGTPVQLTAGVPVWIGLMWNDPGTPSLRLSRDINANERQEQTGTFTYPTAPDPFGIPSAVNSGPVDVWVDLGGVTVVGTPTGTTFTDTGLTNGVAYGYSVSAMDAAGNESALTDEVIVIPGPPDTTAPSVPGTPTATAGDRRVDLTWSASTDSDSGLKKYRVYRNGSVIAEPTTNAYSNVDLTNGVSFSYTVSAVDNSGNESAQSGAAVATPTAPTIGGVPFLPRELGALGALSVEVAFGANLSADPSTWTWTDVTRDVRQDPGISTSMGRNDESGTSNPANLTITLTNTSGDYSLGGKSKWYPYVRRNTPVRCRINPGDGGGGRVVFWGGADGWTPGWDTLTGKIPVVSLSASGTLRRLGQGSAPVQSAYRRASTALASVISYWPLEEGALATSSRAVRGGSDLQIEGAPDWAASTGDFLCSDALLRMKTSRLAVFPTPYAATGKTQVRTLIMLPEDIAAVPNGAILLSVVMTGSIVRWDIVYTNSPGLEIRAYRVSTGAQLLKTNVGFGILGKPGRLSLALTQNGSNVDWDLSFKDATTADGAGGVSGTITGQTTGIVSWIMYGANQNLGDTVFGHLTLQNVITDVFESTDSLIAFQGEYASSGAVNPFRSRLERLCSENKVPLTRHTSGTTGDPVGLQDFDTMGPQLIGPLLDLLREAEAADQGQLWDGRTNGLNYTTRRRREEGIVKLTINAATGQLAAGFAPTDDDQRTRNKVEAKRKFGIVALWEDSTGPLGTGAIGIYDTSITINAGRDDAVIQHAQWQVSLGTVDGHRYPSVTIDLRKAPSLAAAVLDIIPGERLDVTGLDVTLAAFTAPSVSLIVEGIRHEIRAASWKVTFLCSPFEPWAVGRVAAETGDTSDMVMRLDTDGSTLVSNVPTGGTSLPVSAVGTAAQWTTNSDDYPMMIQVGGLPIRATGCATAVGAAATVGKTSNGSSSSNSSSDKTEVSQFTPAGSGVISAGHARISLNSAGTGIVRVVIYSDVAGAPSALLAQSDAVSLTATTETLTDFVFTGANIISLTGGTAYWIGISWQDPGTPALVFSRDGTASGRVENNSYLANPFSPVGGAQTGVVDVWVDYTLAVPQQQNITVDPLPVPRYAGAAIALWQPRRIGMGKTGN